MSVSKDKEPSPQILNTLIEYFQKGNYGEAEKLATSVTQQFPKNYFGWMVLGTLFKNKGDLSLALEAHQKAVELNPLDGESQNNLGNTFLALDRLDEAEKSYKKAIKINPDNHLFYCSLGNLYLHSKKFNDSMLSYKKAVELQPDYSSAHESLGSALKALGRLEESKASYIKSINLEPKNSNYYMLLGRVLRELGEHDESIKNYKKSIDLDPENIKARYSLGISLFESRNYKEASEHFKLIDFAHSKSFALKCSYLQDNQSTFYELLDNTVRKGEINSVIGSLSCRSEIRYGLKKSNPFCNEPLKYILKTDLKKNYDFKNIFIDTTKDILSDDTLSPKSTSLVNNGYQTTGNIFDRTDDNINAIRSIIYLEIERYRRHFNDSDEGVIIRFPSNYSLHGWLISMRNGGNLDSHMHDNGWLSGSIYINVPPKINIDSGNLVVCIDDGQFGTKSNKNQKESIDVVTGSLCLFPSSLLHHTVPFESKKEERIVLAFDVIPN